MNRYLVYLKLIKLDLTTIIILPELTITLHVTVLYLYIEVTEVTEVTEVPLQCISYKQWQYITLRVHMIYHTTIIVTFIVWLCAQ